MNVNDPGVLGIDKSKSKYKFPELKVIAREKVLSHLNVEKGQEQNIGTCFIQIPNSVSGYDYIPYVDDYLKWPVHKSSMKLQHQVSVEYSTQLGYECIEQPENEDGKISKELEVLANDYFDGKTEVNNKIIKAITNHLCSESEDWDDNSENSENEDEERESDDMEIECIILYADNNCIILDPDTDCISPDPETENMDIETENMDLEQVDKRIVSNDPTNSDIEVIDLTDDE